MPQSLSFVNNSVVSGLIQELTIIKLEKPIKKLNLEVDKEAKSLGTKNTLKKTAWGHDSTIKMQVSDLL